MLLLDFTNSNIHMKTKYWFKRIIGTESRNGRSKPLIYLYKSFIVVIYSQYFICEHDISFSSYNTDDKYKTITYCLSQDIQFTLFILKVV